MISRIGNFVGQPDAAIAGAKRIVDGLEILALAGWLLSHGHTAYTDNGYFAKLRIRKDGEIIEVDCRPSDAIALAVTAKVPIFVAEDVIEEAAGEM